MTISEFIEARLAEDEAVAVAASIAEWEGERNPHPVLDEWRYEDRGEVVYVAEPHMVKMYDGRMVADPPPHVTMDSEGILPSIDETVGPHIARHDPARVLREVKAKRAILKVHDNWPVLVESPLTVDPLQYGDNDPLQYGDNDSVTLRVARQSEWLTTRAFVERFGSASLVTPMLQEMARVYCDHPDYQVEWD